MARFKVSPCDFITFLIEILLWIVFIYWTGTAIAKYYRQPVSTQIKHVRAKNVGESGLVLPTLTFCEDNSQYLRSIFQKYNCEDKEHHFVFLSSLRDCMKRNPNFDMNLFIKDLTLNRSKIFQETSLKIFKEPALNLDNYWNMAFHLVFGPCFMLHPEEVEYGKILEGNENLKVKLHPNSTWQSFILFFHDIKAFSDDHSFLAKYEFSLRPNINTRYGFELSKKKISKVSTRDFPCGTHLEDTCYDISVKTETAKNHNCYIPVLENRNWIRDDNLKICDNNITIKVFDALFKKESRLECPDIPPCEDTKIIILNIEQGDAESSEISIKYGDPTVEIHASEISYDFQSMISEIGGTLGLTLGASGLSVAGIIVDFLKKAGKTLKP